MDKTRRHFLRSVALGTSAVVSSISAEASPAEVEREQAFRRKRKVDADLSSALSKVQFAKAFDAEGTVIYRPTKRPGYSAWVKPWRGPDGALFLCFIEERRGHNPLYHPIPLAFWEAMVHPYKYQAATLNAKNIVRENVVLQSLDEGNTWKEVGRSLLNDINSFAFMSLPDGSFIRSNQNSFQAYYQGERFVCAIQRSTDLGNTWYDYAMIGEDHWFYPYRVHALRDGALVLLLQYLYAFGPGRKAPQRYMILPDMRTVPQASIYYSYDQAASWQGPVPVLPGVSAWEPDMVELPSGDLLLINSDVQGGANVRQRVRRQGRRFVPEPVFDISQGPVPETIVLTKEDLLVGARRNSVYCCSKDEGKTWYQIGGLPNSLYQPRLVQLKDGRFCNFGHFGGDNLFGQIDQYIGKQVFRLEEHLPAPTSLVISRDMNAPGTRYIGAYTAVLKAGDDGIPDKEIVFTVKTSSPNLRAPVTKKYIRRTDTEGRARLSLPGFENCVDIYRYVTTQAEFAPEVSDIKLTPAHSAIYCCYAMSPTVGKKNTYEFFAAQQQLFVAREMLDKFPEIRTLVTLFGEKACFSENEVLEYLKLDQVRAQEFLQTLLTSNVLRAGRGKVFSWNGVRVNEVQPIEVEDDFVR